MPTDFRCTRCGFTNRTIASLSTALLAIAHERGVHPTLSGIVDAVRGVASARFAALTITDERGDVAEVVTSAVSDEMQRAVGSLRPAPRIFELALQEPLPVRIPHLREDPRASAAPQALTDLQSFLGVRLAAGDDVLGALCLFGRIGAPSFTAADQEAVQMLSSHVLLALDNARLYERSLELTVIEERNRLARELHDAVSQTLFSIVFTARSAATLLDRDTEAAREQIAQLQRLAQDAQREMRSLIFELRPAEIEREGLVATLRKHVEVLRRVHAAEIELSIEGEHDVGPRAEKELLRIAQEALSNALRHAAAASVTVRLVSSSQRVRMEVRDDGKGFDPSAPAGARRFGLTSMRERAQLLGGELTLQTTPGTGTVVAVEVPNG